MRKDMDLISNIMPALRDRKDGGNDPLSYPDALQRDALNSYYCFPLDDFWAEGAKTSDAAIQAVSSVSCLSASGQGCAERAAAGPAWVLARKRVSQAEREAVPFPVFAALQKPIINQKPQPGAEQGDGLHGYTI